METREREEEEVEYNNEPTPVKESWLTKNVRPIVLLFLVVYVSVVTIYDSLQTNEFSVQEAWIDLFQAVITAAIGGYFLGRTIDKGARSFRRYN